MTEKPKWYKLTCESVENNSVETTDLKLDIERLGFYVQNSRSFARDYYTSKYTVIREPHKQFQIKLVFSGREKLEIYWRKLTKSNLCEFMEWKFEASSWFCGYESYHRETNIPYAWVQSFKWQKCPFRPSEYDFNDGLKLRFTFKISLAARANNAPQLLTKMQEAALSDFQNLFTNDDVSNYDVTIKSVDGEEFKVHKNILAVRCKVLKAHFEHNTIESKTSIVETQWEAKVLREVLSFLYTGSAPGINDEPGKILAAADFYQLEGLKILCVETMIEMLTAENAILTLTLAMRHSVDTLRDQTLQFIKDGHARLITESESWANVPCEIMKLIYEFITADEKISYNIIAEAYEECKAT